MVHKFSAAHFLPEHKGKCRNLHGHTWKVQVDIQTRELIHGMIMDFGDIKLLIDTLDHSCLNDRIKDPTAENIAKYIYEQIVVEYVSVLKGVNKEAFSLEVTVWESENASISYKEG